MSKRVVLSSVDAPFIGGAGTNSYNLIKLFKNSLKHHIVGLFIFHENSYNIDPDKVGNILSYNPKKDKLEDYNTKITDMLGGPPDILLAKNYISVFFLKKIFPKTKVCLLPSGSSFYGHYVNKHSLIPMSELITKLQTDQVKLHDVIDHRGKWPCYPESCRPGCDCELRAMLLSDMIIPNSALTESLLKLLYKHLSMKESVIGKIMPYNFTSGLYDLANLNAVKKIDFAKRKYDLAFICYSWDRKLKNVALVEKLINSPVMRKYQILVIGNTAPAIKTKNFNVTKLGYVGNKSIFQLLTNTRVLACVSYYDSFPNVVTEANLCGCNVVLSANVGQCKLVDKRLVVGNFYSEEQWLEKIELAIKSKFTPFRIEQIKILKDLNVLLFGEVC